MPGRVNISSTEAGSGPTAEQLIGMETQGSVLVLEKIVAELVALSEYRDGIVLNARRFVGVLQDTMNSEEPGSPFNAALLVGAHRTVDRIERASE